MLSGLIALLSSSGVGSIIGILGGALNRYLDQKNRMLDQKFELEKMDRQRLAVEAEYKARTEIAVVEGEARVEAEGYKALSESYSFAAPSTSDGLVDKISKTIRPVLTLCFFIFTCVIFYDVVVKVQFLEISQKTDDVWKLYVYIIQWVFFQSGAAIGWWFAMRPGRFTGKL